MSTNLIKYQDTTIKWVQVRNATVDVTRLYVLHIGENQKLIPRGIAGMIKSQNWTL